jgi:hypothetical protein
MLNQLTSVGLKNVGGSVREASASAEVFAFAIVFWNETIQHFRALDFILETVGIRQFSKENFCS